MTGAVRSAARSQGEVITMLMPVSHRSGPRRHVTQRRLLAPGLLMACLGAAIAWLTPAPVQAASIYLCKTHGGATFWSSAHCREHGALIDRIESVPDGLPFDQQVALAEQNRAAAARLYQAPAPSPRGTSTTTQTTTVNGQVVQATGQSKGEECKALDAHITQLDAQARQPQTAQMQDWLRSQKQKARDRQFQLRC